MASALNLALAEAAATLDGGGFRFAVIGGLAVSARAVVRTTNDVDLAVAVASDEEADAVGMHLRRHGYVIRDLILQDDTGRSATLRLQPPVPAGFTGRPASLPMVDVLFASSGIEPEAVAAATAIEILPGLHLATARIPHLIAMKLLSECDRRRKDRDDIQTLSEAASGDDRAEVERLIQLIESRGSDRGKNLRAVLLEYANFLPLPSDSTG